MSGYDQSWHRPPVGGIDSHVGAARLYTASAPAVETFSRGIGRNRVAILVPEPLAAGERVRFEVQLVSGHLSGVGRVERLHVEPTGDGSVEYWAIIDYEELEPTGAANLVRTLFRHRTSAPLAQRIETPRTMAPGVPEPDATPKRPRVDFDKVKRPVKPVPESEQPKARRRPQVGRYEAPEANRRFRRS